MSVLRRAGVAEAWSALLASKQRSSLALIGIVIGVASVSSMISVGTIVREEAVRQFKELGTEIFDVRLRAVDRARKAQAQATVEQANGLAELASVAASAPYADSSAEVVLEGRGTAPARVVGTTHVMPSLLRLRMAEGRFVTRLDAGRYFCVIGADIARDLLEAAPQAELLGASVRIGEFVHTVVGVLAPVPVGRRPFDPNRMVAIPIADVPRVIPKGRLRDIVARMAPEMGHARVEREVGAYFKRVAPHLTAKVSSAEELIESMHRQMQLYTLLLGTVGGISLLVGGIGVMNVMLVAVSERKVEIGLRRALGARRRDVQFQFLFEAVILSFAGGVLGVLLAVAATWGICRWSGWLFTLSADGTLLGVAVSAGSGVFFGFYPAHQAARLDPVAALHGR